MDIVDGLENNIEKHEVPRANSALAGGLDTTDSGYSQDTYKERSPLTSESVNSDEEEAAVLEDIFFLSASVNSFQRKVGFASRKWSLAS